MSRLGCIKNSPKKLSKIPAPCTTSIPASDWPSNTVYPAMSIRLDRKFHTNTHPDHPIEFGDLLCPERLWLQRQCSQWKLACSSIAFHWNWDGHRWMEVCWTLWWCHYRTLHRAQRFQLVSSELANILRPLWIRQVSVSLGQRSQSNDSDRRNMRRLCHVHRSKSVVERERGETNDLWLEWKSISHATLT